MEEPLPDLEAEILALLLQGDQEIAAGVGYDLDEVLDEADRLLAGCDA